MNDAAMPPPGNVGAANGEHGATDFLRGTKRAKIGPPRWLSFIGIGVVALVVIVWGVSLSKGATEKATAAVLDASKTATTVSSSGSDTDVFFKGDVAPTQSAPAAAYVRPTTIAANASAADGNPATTAGVTQLNARADAEAAAAAYAVAAMHDKTPPNGAGGGSGATYSAGTAIGDTQVPGPGEADPLQDTRVSIARATLTNAESRRQAALTARAAALAGPVVVYDASSGGRPTSAAIRVAPATPTSTTTDDVADVARNAATLVSSAMGNGAAPSARAATFVVPPATAAPAIGSGDVAGVPSGPLSAAGVIGAQRQQFTDSVARDAATEYLGHLKHPPLGEYELKAGTRIKFQLETAIKSDLPGPVEAIITENAFDSKAHKYCLIPRGARLLGWLDNFVVSGQSQIGIGWQRLIWPDTNDSIVLGSMPALDTAGETGMNGRVDNHVWPLVRTTLLTALLGAGAQLSQPQAVYGQPIAIGQTASGALGQAVFQTGNQLVTQHVQQAPTITVTAHTSGYLYIEKDIILDPVSCPNA